mmetsp:Transcript_7940/g.14070  ORF Transcript_7940/g.14070 Transcript_7940/m.14070 type:complete len:221 (-) Transcript_7940:330-992(-)
MIRPDFHRLPQRSSCTAPCERNPKRMSTREEWVTNNVLECCSLCNLSMKRPSPMATRVVSLKCHSFDSSEPHTVFVSNSCSKSIIVGDAREEASGTTPRRGMSHRASALAKYSPIMSNLSCMTLLSNTPRIRTPWCWHMSRLSASSSNALPSPPLTISTMSRPRMEATLALSRFTMLPTPQWPVPSTTVKSLAWLILSKAVLIFSICSSSVISPSINLRV